MVTLAHRKPTGAVAAQSLGSPLILLDRNRSCERCDLSQSAQSICINMRRMFSGPPGTSAAVLITGIAPGGSEDIQDANFVGASGRKLDEFYVHGGRLNDYADIWVTNAIRCHPPENADPTRGQLTACRPYLLGDIQRLSTRYRRLLVLGVGAPAILALTGRTLDEQFKRQGLPLNIPELPNLPCTSAVFGTFHPAYLLRDPRHERPVQAHVIACREWLETGAIGYETPPPIINLVNGELKPCLPPHNWSGALGFDLETYGCLRDELDQTCFHPRKMMEWDKIPRERIIVVAGLYGTIAGRRACVVLKWSDPEHRACLLRWLEAASSIEGQHLQFDLKVLATCAGSSWFNTHIRRKYLREQMFEAFVHDDVAPEGRSIKATSFILRSADYSDEPRPVKAYASEDDPALWSYVAMDAWAAPRNIEILDTWTRERFGSHPIARSKLSEFRKQYHSDMLWTAIHMEQSGVVIDLPTLERIHGEVTTRMNELRGECLGLGCIVSGKGSDGSLRGTLEAAVSMLRARDEPAIHLALDSLESTEKTKALCINAVNRNILMGQLPRSDADCRAMSDLLARIDEYTSLEKIATSYTGPLLYGRKIGDECDYIEVPTKSKKAKNPTMRRKVPGTERPVHDGRGHIPFKAADRRLGIAFPQWFLVPRGADESGRGGGVSGSSRWSAKDPAIQTFPDTVDDILTTRFDSGVLGAWDLSGAEWRGAMFLAGDRRGLKEISDGMDAHKRAATFLMSWKSADDVLPWLYDSRELLIKNPDPMMRGEAVKFFGDGRVDETAFVAIVAKFLRQNVGKSPDFAWLYGCTSPETIQASIRTKAGLDISLGRCGDFLSWLGDLYPELNRTRNAWLDAAVRDGAMHLPILGQSRTFGDDEEAIRSAYRGKVLDHPVQTVASNILQAASIDVYKAIVEHGWRTHLIINRHDAMYLDVPYAEWLAVSACVDEVLSPTGTAYIRELNKHYRREFPLATDRKILVAYNCEVKDDTDAHRT